MGRFWRGVLYGGAVALGAVMVAGGWLLSQPPAGDSGPLVSEAVWARYRDPDNAWPHFVAAAEAMRAVNPDPDDRPKVRTALFSDWLPDDAQAVRDWDWVNDRAAVNAHIERGLAQPFCQPEPPTIDAEHLLRIRRVETILEPLTWQAMLAAFEGDWDALIAARLRLIDLGTQLRAVTLLRLWQTAASVVQWSAYDLAEHINEGHIHRRADLLAIRDALERADRTGGEFDEMLALEARLVWAALGRQLTEPIQSSDLLWALGHSSGTGRFFDRLEWQVRGRFSRMAWDNAVREVTDVAQSEGAEWAAGQRPGFQMPHPTNTPADDRVWDLRYALSLEAQTRADIRLALVVAAVRLYGLERGRLPARLDDLVPDYLSRVPNDPLGTGPLHSRDEGRRFVVWSVGVDGIDQGGYLAIVRGRRSDVGDLVWRLEVGR